MDTTEITADDREQIHALATMLVRDCGQEATAFAKRQALKAKAKSEPLKAEVWRLIAEATVDVIAAEETDHGGTPGPRRAAARWRKIPAECARAGVARRRDVGGQRRGEVHDAGEEERGEQVRESANQ
jgi:hypothetical protein